MDYIHFKVSYIETVIEKSYGENFENIASFIMHLTDPSFIGTRNTKDGGIDGIKSIGNGLRAIYSTYGPKERTDWARAKLKLNEDAFKAKKILERHQNRMKKWCIILNRNLDGDEIELIWNVCRTHNINERQVDIITPRKLIVKIEEHDVTIVVARFLGLITYREIPFDDLQAHAVANKALNLLTQIKHEGKEAINVELQKILSGIIKQAGIYEKENVRNHINLNIIRRTNIRDEFVKSYVYTDGIFKEQIKDGSELTQPDLFMNAKGHFEVTVRNLYMLYKIVKRLLRDSDDYNIEQALINLINSQRMFSSKRSS